MKNKPLLFIFLLFIGHFFISVILGTMLGIYTYIASFIALFVICVSYERNKKKEYSPGNIKKTLFGTISFSGVLLVSLALRFAIEALFPDLSYKLNILSLCTKTGTLTPFWLYAVVSALGIMAVSVFLTDRATDGYSQQVRYLCAAFLTALFALDFSSFLANMLLGIFLLYLTQNGVSKVYLIFLSFIFRATMLFFDFIVLIAGVSYGSEMGGRNVVGMLLLFAGIAAILFAVSDIFLSEKFKKTFVITICISGALLTVIGCATVQYFNL